MDNIWGNMGEGIVPLREVSYTNPIDIGDSFEGPVDPTTDFPPMFEVGQETRPLSGSKGGKGVSKRSGNFSTKEDELLCAAYVNVSKDPIVGVNQPIGSYWARIMKYYEANKRWKTIRTQSSLTHRWGEIQKETGKFCGYFSKIERKRRSGTNEDDTIKDALQMFEELEKYHFKFIHCWLVLRREHKWNSWLAQMEANNEPDPANPQNEIIDNTLPPKLDRPIGRDKAKKQRSDGVGSSSSACLEVLQKMSMDQRAFEDRQEAATKEEAVDNASRSDRKLALQEAQLEVTKAQLVIQQRALDMQQEDREERYMNIDIDKLQPWVREYYVNKQKMIAAMSKGSSSGGPPVQ